MAASIKGKLVVWGITAGIITATHAATGSGVVQSFSMSLGGETGKVNDEDNDIVTRIDHAGENKLSMEVLCEPDTELPVKGSELTGLGTIDGVDLSVGRVFVDEPKVDYSNSAVKKISISATHYPAMPDDDA